MSIRQQHFFILLGCVFITNIGWAKGKKPSESVEQQQAQKQGTQSNPQQPIVPIVPQIPVSQEHQFHKLSLEEAKQIHDTNSAIFVDARSPASYGVRHIKGALNCSLGDFDRQLAELKEKVPLDVQLIVYCGAETCGLADRVGRQLSENGFKNVSIFPSGWVAWAQANFPMEP